MTLNELLDKKLAKRGALVERSQASEDVQELRSLNERVQELTAEIDDLRAMVEAEKVEAEARQQAEAQETAEEKTEEQADEVDARTAAVTEEDERMENRNIEARASVVFEQTEQESRAKEQGAALREGRSVTLASDIVVPSYSSNTINNTFLQVSNLLDAVNVLQLPGGEAYRQPYEKDTPAGDYTAEGGNGATADMVFGYADIAKAKITAYSEITEEIEKLPAAPYAETVMAGISKSIRRKLAKEILVGAGGTNKLVGIFDATHATAIDAATDLSVATIDNTTLDNIVYSYGGDEAVEGACVLILNKKDLAAFAKLRNTDGSKHHDIRPAGNGGSGTIDGVPYIINSACKAISDASTSTADYCMAYGNLKNYQLTIFSPMEVSKSADYKFKEGMLAHRGVVFAGGNVVSHNGFIRVKKAAVVGG